VNAVLYVPVAGDPHGVLAPGVCGATVPMLWRHDLEGTWHDRRPTADSEHPCYSLPDPPATAALVLALAGVPLPEGCDRAARVLAAAEGISTVQGYRFWLGFDSARTRKSPLTSGFEAFVGGRMIGWALAGDIGSEQRHYDNEEYPALGHPPYAEDHPMLRPWALAHVIAARLGGEVVTL
jgi:hypothetical protein